MRLIVGLMVLMVWAAPRVADACSCSVGSVSLSPADGSTNVPTNARIIVAYDTDTAEVELREAGTQTLIPLTFDVHRRMRLRGTWQIANAVPLQPATVYQLSAQGSFGSRRSTFTTGNTPDVTPSVFGGLESMSLETMTYPFVEEDGRVCNSACIETVSGHVSRIRLGHPDAPPDVTLLVFELLRMSDRVLVDQVPLNPRGYAYDVRFLGPTSCERGAPVLEPNEHYCGRVVAYDLAGNVSGQTVEICEVAATCRPIATASSCEPEDVCLPPASSSSPNGCATTRGTTSGLLVVVLFAATRRRRNVAVNQTA